MTEILPEATRRHRREGTRRPVTTTIQQQARIKSKRAFPPVNLLSEDELESIHRASLKVLAEIGMDFMLPEARERLQKAGAKVVGERVHFDPAMVEELIAHAPSSFTVHARNPERNLTVGGPNIEFGTVGSPPNSSDMDSGRRAGTYEDYRKFLKLAQYFNCIGFISTGARIND